MIRRHEGSNSIGKKFLYRRKKQSTRMNVMPSRIIICLAEADLCIIVSEPDFFCLSSFFVRCFILLFSVFLCHLSLALAFHGLIFLAFLHFLPTSSAYTQNDWQWYKDTSMCYWLTHLQSQLLDFFFSFLRPCNLLTAVGMRQEFNPFCKRHCSFNKHFSVAAPSYRLPRLSPEWNEVIWKFSGPVRTPV